MQPIEVRLGEDGVPVFEDGPRCAGFSLGVLFGSTTDRRWLTVECDGAIVLRGVNAAGAPVELRYRATGFRPDDMPGVNEGGVLVCERVA